MKGRSKILWVLASLLMVAVLVLTSCGTSGSTATTTQSERVFRLTFQGKWEGMESQRWCKAQLALADAVYAATNGRIIITNIATEIVSDANVIDAVRTGVLDLGVQGLHSRGETALQNFISLPFVDFDHVYDLLQQTDSITLPAWDSLGVKALGNMVYLPQFIFTAQPCNTFDELTSMKLRITGTILNDMISKAGGHPQTMDAESVLQAIQRGTIDGSQSALPAFFNYSWYEACDYMAAWPMGCNGFGLIMNQNVWNDLGSDLQSKLMSCINDMIKNEYDGALLDIQDLVKKAADNGVTRLDPTQAEKDKLLAFAGQAVADWKAKVGESKGNQMLAIINKVLGTNY